MIVDIGIVGGGPVGAALALAAARSGCKVALVEPGVARPMPVNGFDTRVYSLGQRSRQLLEECGVWDELAQERTTPVHDMRVVGDDEASRLAFSAYRSEVRELAVIVEESNLRQALARALDAQTTRVTRQSAQFQSVSWAKTGRATCLLSDGTSLDARLLVAADGADSTLRAAAGLVPEVRDYAQTGVVANFRISLPHRNTAYQWFREDGVLAMLPLPGMHMSMVWSTGREQAQTLLSLDAESLAARVQQACTGTLGKLTGLGAATGFPLRWMRVRRLIAPRLALVGDAAHLVHPLAGQGLNLGFGDVGCLARILAQRGMEDDCGAQSLLRRYERSRSEDILAMQCVTDGLQRLFGADLPGLRRLRNLGLRATDRIAPLKRWLVNRALG
ncbi:MAG: FAD-dependent monooxygenase [Burkholderiales bacterium]